VDVGQELLHGRTVKGSPREGTVVIMLRDEPPALWHLALDIGLAGLALSVERVEREVKVMLLRV
jgi:hypothetical protein